jgi:23S rRNA (adenine2503-C2)-methyltransferase
MQAIATRIKVENMQDATEEVKKYSNSNIQQDKVNQEVPSREVRSIKDLHSFSSEELVALAADFKQPKFRATQLEEWIWGKNAQNFDEMTNLPKSFRSTLAQHYTLNRAYEIARQESSDGSRKYLLRFSDGIAVECVGLPSKNRLSVCVSTQAGCAMNCSFCSTGTLGFIRSLSAGEIYEQVMHVQNDFATRVTGVVTMGQGEPFMNYDSTLSALRRFNSPSPTGAGIGARHLTVSTSGIIPMIYRFAKEPEQFTLAVSLHSAVQRTRNVLMPGVKRYSLKHLYEAMENYVEKTNRRPSYEYALIKGINDTDEELDALCDFCRGKLSHINLIRLNMVAGSRYQPTPNARVEEFARSLERSGIETTIRKSRGEDIEAACGQLHKSYISKF